MRRGSTATAALWFQFIALAIGALMGCTQILGIDSGELAPDAGSDACGSHCGAGVTCYRGVCNGNAIVDFSAGSSTSCAVMRSGSVWCWGNGENGELGVDPNTLGLCYSYARLGPGPCRATPAEIQGLANISQVSVGAASVCALDKSGSVWCWGTNAYGALGHVPNGLDATCGDAGPCSYTPQRVDLPAEAAQVVVGYNAACVRTVAGPVYCWGYNAGGQVGNGDWVSKISVLPPEGPASIPSSGIVSLAMAHYAGDTCIADDTGRVWCWGINVYGEAGHSPSAVDKSCFSNYPCTSPSAVVNTGPGNIVADRVQAGRFISCALSGQSLYCWGLGDLIGSEAGTTYSPQTVPGQWIDFSALRNTNVCAVNAQNDVYCWGDNTHGELGAGFSGGGGADASGLTQSCIGNRWCSKTPRQVPDLKAVRVAAGDWFVLALGTDGALYSWGLDNSHAVGPALAESSCEDSNQPEPCILSPQKVQGLP